jgi:hypothetical protein
MDDNSPYLDVRSSLWRSCFETALEYEPYLSQSPSYQTDPWHDTAGKIPALSAEQRQRLEGYHRILNVLMVSGVWCGDCMRQGPIVKQIVDACGDKVQMRVMDRDANLELRDELRILGALRVPVVLFLTEDFFEVGRFGDRTLSTYRKMAASVRPPNNPPVQPAPKDEWATEISEWLDVFERMLLMTRLSPLLRDRHGD